VPQTFLRSHLQAFSLTLLKCFYQMFPNKSQIVGSFVHRFLTTQQQFLSCIQELIYHSTWSWWMNAIL